MSEEAEAHSDLTIKILREKIKELESLVQQLQNENQDLRTSIAEIYDAQNG